MPTDNNPDACRLIGAPDQRERIATALMAATVAHDGLHHGTESKSMALAAVANADTLIEALNRSKPA